MALLSILPPVVIRGQIRSRPNKDLTIIGGIAMVVPVLGTMEDGALAVVIGGMTRSVSDGNRTTSSGIIVIDTPHVSLWNAMKTPQPNAISKITFKSEGYEDSATREVQVTSVKGNNYLQPATSSGHCIKQELI